MNTVKEKVENVEIIKKSKFLAFLHPISSKEEAEKLIREYKNSYKDATHVCYAYLLDENNYKYYDDGEPSNTAGLPIYKALLNKSLVHTLCVIVRYFGGTKLGSNGLVHAYSDGAINVIEKATLIEYKELVPCIIKVSYSLYDSLTYYLSKENIIITNKEFNDDIYLDIYLSNEEIMKLQQTFPNIEITKS